MYYYKCEKENGMRLVIQRVTEAGVKIPSEHYEATIGPGLLVLLGVESQDGDEDIEWLCRKMCHMRIFSDENEVMNKSVIDVNGEALIISQFTLHASTKKGNRPSYIKAAKPDIAIPLYEKFIAAVQGAGLQTKQGIFGADMKVSLINDGPVTIIIDSKIKE